MLLENNYYQQDLANVLQADLAWDTFKGKSFLIVGASGLIGSFLIDCLMKADQAITIYAMGRNEAKLKERFAAYLADPHFQLVIGDVTAEIPLSVSCDYVFHAASNTHPKAYAYDPIGTIMTNIKGTENVLEYARKYNVTRTLFLSTVEIYGENRGEVDKFSETDCGYIDCNTLRAGYPEGKRASEALCQAYIQQYDLDIVLPRLCRVFGPTVLKDDSKASSQFIMNAVHNEDIVLKSAGTQFYSYCYVADAVYALLYLLIHGKKGEAYNIGNEDFDLTLKELASSLAQAAGTNVIFAAPEASEALGFSKATKAVLALEKLRALGWQPIYTLDQALEHTIQILRDEEF